MNNDVSLQERFDLFNDIKVVGEVKLSYKPQPITDSKVSSSADAAEFLRPAFAEYIQHCEMFAVLCLNRANQPIGYGVVSIGGLSGTVVDPRKIMQFAILTNSTSVILAHNHPSGNLQPSETDIKLTKKLVDAGNLVDIKVLDHVILTHDSLYSFADNGMI